MKAIQGRAEHKSRYMYPLAECRSLGAVMVFKVINQANQFLCGLRSIAAHKDHFVGRLSVCLSVCLLVCLSGSHTFLVVTHSYVLQVTSALL